MIQYGLQWPLVMLDFEASALHEDSYPIEAGIARWNGPQAPIITWSSLIAPDREWVRSGIWILESQRIHGIAPSDLEGAPTPDQVLTRMTSLVGDATFTSDNPYWESKWLKRLGDAAGATALPRVDDLSRRLDGVDPEARRRAADHLRRGTHAHRAGPDALAVVEAVAHGLGFAPVVEYVPPD